MTLEELMPDPDRRDVALGGLAIVVEHADEIYGADRQPGGTRGSRPRWLDVVQEMSHGHTAEQAAERLHIAPFTVKSHLKKAARALGTKNAAHAVAECLRQGLIE